MRALMRLQTDRQQHDRADQANVIGSQLVDPIRWKLRDNSDISEVELDQMLTAAVEAEELLTTEAGRLAPKDEPPPPAIEQLQSLVKDYEPIHEHLLTEMDSALESIDDGIQA